MRIPGEAATALDWTMFEQSGVLTRRQAVAELGPGKVRHLVATGRWRAVCRGVLLTHNAQPTAEQQPWIAILAAGPGAVLAGLAAARAAGLRGRWRREVIDVLVPATRAAADLLRRLPMSMPAVKVHRAVHLPDEDVQIGRPARTATPRSLVDAAQWAPSTDEARSIIVAGCQQRLVTPKEIYAVVERMPRARRRSVVLETVRYAEGGAEALSEIDFVRLCRRHRLPLPDLQEVRRDASGRTRYLDAYWRQWQLHAEVDGAHHMDVRHWAADMIRQNEVWISGDRLLRFPAWLVRSRPHEVAAQLRAALLAAGWRPGAR
jgi:very-short-patch-repair endonuclease